MEIDNTPSDDAMFTLNMTFAEIKELRNLLKHSAKRFANDKDLRRSSYWFLYMTKTQVNGQITDYVHPGKDINDVK